MALLIQSDSCVRLQVRLQPKASRNAVVGIQQDYLKIALCAPPVDGAANKALCEYLAKLLGIAKSSVVLISGEKSRNKTVAIYGITMKNIEAAMSI